MILQYIRQSVMFLKFKEFQFGGVHLPFLERHNKEAGVVLIF